MKRAASLILSLIIALGAAFAALPCLADEDEAVIRFDMSQRQELYKGSTGFLYGASEINVPSIDLLQGLKPDTMVQKAYSGKQHPTGDAVRTASALECAGARDMQIYLQDYYLEWPYDAPMKNGAIDIDSYQKTVEKILYSMICKKSSSTASGAFLGSDGCYYVLDRATASKYSYVLFNEPDQIWFGGNVTNLKKAWKQIYDAVHRIDSNARCVGPNYSGFNSSQYNSFLRLCSNEKCLPEIISWHELGDISLTDFKKHYNDVESYVSKYYTSSYFRSLGRSFTPQLMVNEYARHYDIGSPGGLVKWLAMLEDVDMSGCMAYWAFANSLNEMAADQNSPTSTWWVYHWYAQMTGKQCPLVSPDFDKTRFYGISSYDEEDNIAYAIFGGEDEKSREAVLLDNISSTALASASGVAVRLYGVSFSGQLGACYKPELIFDGAVRVQNNSVRIAVDNTDEMDAYYAVLTPADESAVACDMQGIHLSKQSYEAENAHLINGATAYPKDWWSAFATSGRRDVGSINNNGDGVRFDIDIPESGRYNLSLFYSLQAPYVNPVTLAPDNNGQNRGIGKTLPFGVSIDGGEVRRIYLESTATWLYKNHYDYEAYLTAGEHSITFTQINGNEGNKGNLQLTCALDKLDVALLEDSSTRYNFDIDLTHMKGFKDDNGYSVTAVAPREGYYTITADGNFTLSRQGVGYAADAKSTSRCSTLNIPVSSTLYLSRGANTINVSGSARHLAFTYRSDITADASTVINAADIFIHGANPVLKSNAYALSRSVISGVGIGQSPSSAERAEANYIEFKVNAGSSGYHNFSIRYSNNEPAPAMLKSDGSTYVHPYNIDLVERYAQIKVNNTTPKTVYFRNTLSWSTFRALDVVLYLNAGVNTIRIYNDNSYQFSTLVNSTAPDIDRITITRLSYNGSGVTAMPKSTASQRHTYSLTGTKTSPATASSNGSVIKSYRCSVCGNSYSSTSRTISKIASVTLSKARYTYNGKAKKPSVTVKDSRGGAISSSHYTVKYSSNTRVGRAKATITFKNDYSGSIVREFTIAPPTTSLSKPTPVKKGIKLKWSKKTAQVSGYEIQYSTSSAFKSPKSVKIKKNSTASTTIKGLKSKKIYYVRIRTYKTLDGKAYYSDWSDKKKVKTA